MQTEIYQVDAFTDKIFGGNPAAVCPLNEWLPDQTLLNIAAENNLSETAFFIPSESNDVDYDLRWFMPEAEVDLCGHATMAAAFIIFNHLGFNKKTVKFSSRSGILEVTKENENLCMSFPIWPIQPHNNSEDVSNALGKKPTALFKGQYWMAVFDSEDDIRSMKPNFNALKNLDEIDFLIVTAKSKDNNLDFISRFFCPKLGVNEDPVTGSAHCITAPYWANQFNKTMLYAYQASKRGGHIKCHLKDNHVEITGTAALYMKGIINV